MTEEFEHDLEVMFEEMGELKTVNGKSMKVIEENVEYLNYKRGGYQKIDLLFLVRKSEYGRKPDSGAVIEYENDSKKQLFKVITSNNDCGLIEIKAERYSK